MNHEFTDKQITTAANKSLFHYGEYNSERGYSWSMTAESLRSFLDALPEPQDEWEQCTIDQVRKGDRVRWQIPDLEDICIYEVIALQTTPDAPGWVLDSKTGSYYFPPGAVVDRIPAPAQHPDPKEHPVIIVRDSTHGHTSPVVAMWHGVEYVYTDENKTPQGLYRDDITDWSPAKVVEDDR